MATEVQCAPFTVKISMELTPQKIECRVTITNNEDKDYCLLRRHTPLEGLMSDIFNVQLTGSGKIPYSGILLKRGPPSEKEYILIKSKSSEENKVNLSHAYCIDSPGNHTVQLKISLKFQDPNEEKHSGNHFVQKVESNMAEFTVTERKHTGEVTKRRIEPDRTRGTPLFKKPDASGPKSPKLAGNYPSPRDKGETKHAYKLAYSAIEKSIPSTTETSELYKEWFGDPHKPTVKSNYTTMKSTMEKTEFTLHARPTEDENGDKLKEISYYGFTYKDNSTIYLGDCYFDADLEGTDSKMGTIVHEMSHAAAGTEDVKQDGNYVYGQEECQKLAMDHPELAIINADNYEYLSEAQ